MGELLRSHRRLDGRFDGQLPCSSCHHRLDELLESSVPVHERGRLEDLSHFWRDPDVELRQVPDPQLTGHSARLILACERARLYTVDSSTYTVVPMALPVTAGGLTERTLDRVLGREAERLRFARPTPIDLGRVLADLGVRLQSEAPSYQTSGDGWLRRNGAGWQIVVRPGTGEPRRRFTIAHELAHYVVESRIGYRPVSVRDYWMLEAACQRFAAELLSPREIVESAMAPGIAQPEDVVDAADRLIITTNLSLEAAVRRIVDTATIPIAVTALRIPDAGSSSSRYGQIGWDRTNRSATPERRGLLIRKDHPMREVVEQARALSPGHSNRLALPNAALSCVVRRNSGLALVVALLDLKSPAAPPEQPN